MSDHHEDFRKKVGDIVMISLKSNPTTGYLWRFVADNGLKVESEYVPDIVEKGFVGGGGKQVFSISALEKGRYNISFSYIRPWESSSIESKDYTLIFE